MGQFILREETQVAVFYEEAARAYGSLEETVQLLPSPTNRYIVQFPAACIPPFVSENKTHNTYTMTVIGVKKIQPQLYTHVPCSK